MCGICGVISMNGDPIERSVIEAMNAALVHRGPDSEGTFVDGGAGLAARRLAIIDLETGDQPIANEDATLHVVQNGEIYNYRELREELLRAGHRFRTRGDTEVLVHLYEEHGDAFAERLRGMFAIAIWDARRQRLVLARDRFGIKPLYYRIADSSLSFASELKALLRQPGVSREIDLDALDAYLAFSFVPGPLTIFKEIRKLPPGCLLVWERGDSLGPRVERFARPTPVAAEDVRSEDEDELADELRERLRDSVRAHLVADVPVGVLLSGGIDSSALAAFAALETPGKVSTFSIGFEERRFDERSRARLVAQQYDTDHHELVVRPNAVELLPAIAETFDEPFADSSAIPTYIVSQLARRHVKVALSGEGGDELFGGYYYYTGHVLASRLSLAARVARPLVNRLPSSSAKASTLEYKAKRFVSGAHLPPLERHRTWKEITAPALRAELFRPGRQGSVEPVELLRSHYAESEGADSLARVMDLDLGVFLVDDMLVKTDRASMAHSLEARVPFLDPIVAELALSLPSALKVRGFAKKRLIRRALAPLLPDEILHGRKQGFSIPVAAWLRGELQPFMRDVLSPARVRRQGFFRPEAVTRLVDAHAAGRDYSRQLWELLVFSLWHDRYAGANGSSG